MMDAAASASARRRRSHRWGCAHGTTRATSGTAARETPSSQASGLTATSALGRPSLSSMLDEPAFRRWCATTAAVPRPDQVKSPGPAPAAAGRDPVGHVLAYPAAALEVGNCPRSSALPTTAATAACAPSPTWPPAIPACARRPAGRAPSSPPPSPSGPGIPSTSRLRRPGRPATSSPSTSAGNSTTAAAASTWTGSPSGGCATWFGTTSPMSCGHRPARSLAAPSTTPGVPAWNSAPSWRPALPAAVTTPGSSRPGTCTSSPPTSGSASSTG